MSNKWSPEIQYKPILKIIFNYIIRDFDFWLLVDLALLHNDGVFADFVFALLDNETHRDLFKITTAAIGKPEIEKVVRNRFIFSSFHKREWFEWDSFINLMKTEENHLVIHSCLPTNISPDSVSYVCKISKQNYEKNVNYYESYKKYGFFTKYDINDLCFRKFYNRE